MDVWISRTSIETCLWNIQRYLIDLYGCYQAEQDMEPLKWYVGTGRASSEFLRALMNAKPFMVGRKLHKGGSYEEALQRVKKYIGWEEN